ncbi:YciI family protein [Tellurirhabdus rosea]|uniref:YciI family protein n=1 Tax=Tellurirhabdus rosea TaxID=2674997 RepID=UPI0022508798|nr:YciI family protein [Tellurirhabdus rosea]
MEKFMLIFHNAIPNETAFLDMSPEAMQAEIEKWNTWIGGLAAQGKMHGTEALLPHGKVINGGGTVVTDGPYTEGKEIVGGYTLISAASFDEAVALASGCPIFDSHGSVEVR